MMDRRQFNQTALALSLAAVFAPFNQGAAATGAEHRPTGKAGRLAASKISTQRVTAPPHAVNVRAYGAKGDGKANDTEAFHSAVEEINRNSGGILYIPPGNYLIGRQIFAGATGKGYAYQAAPIIEIKACRRPVVVMGSPGAKLMAAPGLKYGSFDPVTGQAFQPPKLPFLDPDFRSDAYIMLHLHDNAEVTVMNLELDGNLQHLELGGYWADAGRQTDATGLYLINNKKATIQNVHTHHHGLDGLEIAHYGLKPDSAPTPVWLYHVRSEYNGRQGFSWVGGIGLTAISCQFNHTGTVRFCTQPGAGLDIEEESSVIRRGYFLNCTFENNSEWGIVASGNSAHVIFERCSIWGTRSWSMWPNVPHMTFSNCAIHGQMKKVYSEAGNPAAACRFVGCTIDDAIHPSYGPSFGATPLIDLSENPGSGVTYDKCRITSMRGKSFYTINTDRQKPILIKDTTITHGGVPAHGDSLCLLTGTALDNVHFRETYPVKPSQKYQITIRHSTIGQNVVVDGPVVLASVRPFVGTLRQGTV